MKANAISPEDYDRRMHSELLHAYGEKIVRSIHEF